MKSRNSRSRSNFSREERQKANREAVQKLGRRGGSFFMVDEDRLKELGLKRFEAKPGSIFLGILPRIESPQFFKEIHVHYNVGPSKSAFLCPERMYGEQCPICDYRNQLIEDKADKDEYREYFPSRRCLMWVVNMQNHRTINEGIYIYDCPPSIIEGIATACTDPRTGEYDVDVIDDPVNVVFKRSGKGMHDTSYNGYRIEDRIAGEDIPEEYYDLVLDDMEDLLVQPDIDEMEKALGFANSKEEDDGDRSRKSRTDKEPRGRSRIEEDEAEDGKSDRKERQSNHRNHSREEPEETNEDDNDERESRSSRSSGKRKRDFVDEIENPDDDPDDQQELEEKRENVRGRLNRGRDRGGRGRR